ncbi:hypothetical protein [Thermofilum sp.]|uniref:hypothetical protein n=1 Tax=Thermofilum sp. TaxID=1961369 RepID=UPI00316A3990
MKGAEISGYILLSLGVVLLTATFALALLSNIGFTILPSGDFTAVLGESLGFLLSSCVKVMYLGVMGWVGSIVASKGVALLKGEKDEKAGKGASA